MIDTARSHEICAAYLNVAAIAAALLVAVVATGVVIGHKVTCVNACTLYCDKYVMYTIRINSNSHNTMSYILYYLS